jgi:hypothetical protein
MKNNLVSAFILLCVGVIPYSVSAQWVQTNGPLQGRVHAILRYDAQTYIASSGTGIYRSTDGGKHWSQVAHDNNSTPITSFAKLRDTIIGISLAPVKSGDGGATWITAENVGYGNTIISTDSGLFIGTSGSQHWHNYAVMRSTDGGLNWYGAGLIENITVYALAASGGVLIAGTNHGIYLSTNWGGLWSTPTTGFGDVPVRSLFSNGASVFAGTSGSGIFVSTDNGGNWSSRNSGLTDLSVLSIAGDGTNLFAGTTEGVFLSSDGGMNWQARTNGIENVPINVLDAHSGLVIAGTDGNGSFRSTDDGITWKRVGFYECYVNKMRVSGNVVIASVVDGVGYRPEPLYRSSDQGNSWTPVAPELKGKYLSDVFVENGSFYVSTDSGIFSSSDSGLTWHNFETSLGNRYFAWLAKHGRFLIADNQDQYPDTIFISSDSGQSWHALNGFQTTGFPEGCVVFPNDSTVVLNVYDPAIQPHTIVSTDWGTTWATIYQGYIGPLMYRDNFLYLGSIYGSYLGGDWNISNLPGYIGIIYYGNNIFISSSRYDGTLRSRDGGASWSLINYGLPADDITGPIAMTDDYLLLPTREHGIWRRPISDFVTSVPPSVSVPRKFQLLPNFPNPFNPTTTISYALPHSGFVSLSVFNILGQQIALLVNGLQQVGYHDVTFNSDGLTSGIYFYRIQAGEFVQIRKMLLIR